MLAFFAGAEEQGKFALFVSEYERLMFHTANGILNNYHDAEEAVYSALAAVARRFSAVSALAPEKKAAYARRAARNHALNLYKKRSKRAEREVSYEHLSELGAFDSELERVAEDPRISADNIFEHIKKLPALYRDPLILHYAEGMDVKAVARELGIKRETAKTRIARGKKLLACSLGKELDSK